MVFQKKTAVALKNDQSKKKGKKVFEEEDDDLDMFEDMDDSEDDDDEDDDDDSGEETQTQKTPQNKTPKGRQSLSEKKVSFQIPGKNTPVKTPGKQNATPAQKQQTPGKGKTALQEFKGMKGNQNNKAKKDDDDDEGDDDDEEDDDDDDDEDDDLDLQLDDDDDEEDDEDEDDDEDDDDDDESGKAKAPNKAAVSKQKGNVEQNKQTPAKGGDKSKNAGTPKGVQAVKKEPKETTNHHLTELERRRQRDKKMLYVGQLPLDTTPEELKALSSDILDIVMPRPHTGKHSKFSYAFLVFVSEKKAEENLKVLETKKFRDQFLKVDFVGEKSRNKKVAILPKQYNMKKLFITGLPVSSTIHQVAKFFPKAQQIYFNASPTHRTASIDFLTQEDAAESYEANRDIELNGHKLDVLYSVQGGNAKRKKRRGIPKNNQGESPAKKMKKENISGDKKRGKKRKSSGDE